MITPPDTIRLFVGIPIPQKQKQQWYEPLARWREQHPVVRWSDPGQWHWTVKFVGNVSRELLNPIKTVLSEVGTRHKAFNVSTAGPGRFPNKGRPKVLWIGVDQGRVELREIAGDLNEALFSAGIPREIRPFHPHITLARLRETMPKRVGKLTSQWDSNNDFPVLKFSVESFALFESRIQPGGPEYSVIKTTPLVGANDKGE